MRRTEGGIGAVRPSAVAARQRPPANSAVAQQRGDAFPARVAFVYLRIEIAEQHKALAP